MKKEKTPISKRIRSGLLIIFGIIVIILSFIIYSTTILINFIILIIGIILFFSGILFWKKSAHEMRVRHAAIRAGRFDLVKENKSEIKQEKSHVSKSYNCPYCNNPISSGKKFCVKCGKKISFQCPECKSEINSISKFCPKCGKKITIKSDDRIKNNSNIKKESVKFNICPYCGKNLDLPKTPNFCPYCKEKLIK